ncbi:DUF4357 domain-containing protein [Nonomuraea basaltis]|uniref:DUF4357 domain-containing protein n=1 Tax=Nonomuraea basaltis TaxID=2495887 RepID=UPI001F0E35C4|nr:DUF4357 domain-containing protein [Nonomuraea basaltis]
MQRFPDTGTLEVVQTLQRVSGELRFVQTAGHRWRASNLVFTTKWGTPIEPRNFNRSFELHARKAGLPRIRFHDTRHTCASMLAALGVHPRVAMRILRHSQISVTMNVYSRLLESDAGPINLAINLSDEGSAGDLTEPPVVPTGPLAPLLISGLLKPGTQLRLEQKRASRAANATVLANGSIMVEGKSRAYSSPSKAASAVTGSQANGWVMWQLPDGRTLDKLRDELENGDE